MGRARLQPCHQRRSDRGLQPLRSASSDLRQPSSGAKAQHSAESLAARPRSCPSQPASKGASGEKAEGLPFQQSAHAVSFLEQIVEGLPCVGGPQRLGRRSFLFHHDANGVEGAIVALVLAGNSFGDGLRTFKTARGIEVRTLLAGMEFESALGTLANRFTERFKQRSTLRTSRHGPRPRHLNCARAEGVFLDWPAQSLRVVSLLAGLAAVLVATLPVLPV
jgi:hypothetical protein